MTTVDRCICIIVAGLTTWTCAVACAQSTWQTTVSYAPGQTSVNPAHPTCMVSLALSFPPQDYALAGVRWDIHAADSTWNWYRIEDFGSMPPPRPIIGPDISDIATGQIHVPALHVFADPTNPVWLFEAEWVTTDFTPREVTVWTTTSRFDVYVDVNSPRSESRLQALAEGRGAIRVTPSPASLVPLALVVFRRRRR
jgi:hypothetical protein